MSHKLILGREIQIGVDYCSSVCSDLTMEDQANPLSEEERAVRLQTMEQKAAGFDAMKRKMEQMAAALHKNSNKKAKRGGKIREILAIINDEDDIVKPEPLTPQLKSEVDNYTAKLFWQVKIVDLPEAKKDERLLDHIANKLGYCEATKKIYSDAIATAVGTKLGQLRNNSVRRMKEVVFQTKEFEMGKGKMSTEQIQY